MVVASAVIVLECQPQAEAGTGGFVDRLGPVARVIALTARSALGRCTTRFCFGVTFQPRAGVRGPVPSLAGRLYLAGCHSLRSPFPDHDVEHLRDPFHRKTAVSRLANE
jgi:hypothetical protein